jgi:pimeloyl-ACP methyl ester carboxylesterase
VSLTIKDPLGMLPGSSKPPETPAEARANGAVACEPAGIDQSVFLLQMKNGSLTNTYNSTFLREANPTLQAEVAGLRAHRTHLALAPRPVDAQVKFDPRAHGFSWDAAVSGGEFAELAYAGEQAVREQCAKWGFTDTQFVSKKTSIRGIKDLFHARDVQAFATASKDTIVVGFRGTERGSLHDILTDLAALFPLDMTVKALPPGLTAEQRAQFDERLLASMQRRLAVDFKNVVADPNRRLTASELRAIVDVLPEATAEALGDASAGRKVADAIHRGFKESKDLVAPELLTKVLSLWEDDLANQRPLRPVYVAGHSMGGSLATLFGYDLLSMTEQVGALARAAGMTNLSHFVSSGFRVPLGGVYTYGAPRSFKTKAAQEVASLNLGFNPNELIHNFVRLGDPVPNLPDFGNYTSMGNTIYLDGTLGRLEGCPDPRAKAMVNPSQRELSAALEERSDWFDATAPGDMNAHLLGPIRDLIKRAAAAAVSQAGGN